MSCYEVKVVTGWLNVLCAGAVAYGDDSEAALAFLEAELGRLQAYVREHRAAPTPPRKRPRDPVPAQDGDSPRVLVPESPPRLPRRQTPPANPSQPESISSAQAADCPTPRSVPQSQDIFSS